MKIIITESQFNGLYKKELSDKFEIDEKIKLICNVLINKGLPLTVDSVMVASLFMQGGTLTNQKDRISYIISSLNHINEDMSMSSLSSNNSDKGSVTMKKQSTPQDIKKMTDSGLNVSLIDEKLGKEQAITYRHKFVGTTLNIYVTKEKSKLEDIMEYVYSIKDQTKVEKSFEKGKVNLFVKNAASGRYEEMDKKIDHKYYKNINGFKKFGKSKKESSDDSDNPIISEVN